MASCLVFSFYLLPSNIQLSIRKTENEGEKSHEKSHYKHYCKEDTNYLYVTKAKSDGLIHKPIVEMILRMIYDQDIHEF